ncbi:MAG: AAA family ATPase, partial [Elusimicrobiales bacterium]|nr:AAA family ATPase [Elusimicrobiales bacterium]
FELAYEKMKEKMSAEYRRHQELKESNILDEYEHETYRRLLDKTASNAELENSILYLCLMLEKHHGIKPLLLIDEYDVPLQESWYAENRYYNRMVAFIKNMLSAALKTNPSLYKGILTGVTRVSKESIFSGLNNIIVNTVFDDDFSQYFGFTQEEVNEMFRFYGIEDKLKEARNWYDGYIFGEKHIYNPWSVLCYLNKSCKPEPYWINVSSNDLAKDAIRKLDGEDRKSLASLMSGGSIRARASTEFVYTELGEKNEHAYGLLVQTGYLKASRARKTASGYLCTMEIPNRELYSVFSEEIVERIIKKSAYQPAAGIQDAILDGIAEDLEQYLSDFLLEMCSSLNLTEEKDYQNIIIGLCATMRNGYAIHSEREAGYGRADIMFAPRADYEEYDKLPGIVMELKHIKAGEAENNSPEKINALLQKEAETALKQIEEKSYISELKKSGIRNIAKYGVACCGKHVKVLMRH